MNTQEPIPMILHCPSCHTQHIDEGEWETKLHRSHQCESCNFIWRPADVFTVGVKEIKTKGSNDNIFHERKVIAYAAKTLETGELSKVSFDYSEVERYINLRNIVLGKTHFIGPVSLSENLKY